MLVNPHQNYRVVSIELVCKFQFWINAIGGNFANTHMTLNWSIALKELIMQEMQWHQFNHLFMLKNSNDENYFGEVVFFIQFIHIKVYHIR